MGPQIMKPCGHVDDVYAQPIKPTAGSVARGEQVEHPSHYTQGKIECIDAMEAMLTPEEFSGHLKAQVFKYVWRCGKKHLTPLTDLRKAEQYLRRLIEFESRPGV